MPDLFVDVDAAVTVPVNLYPLTDNGDFITQETTIAYNAAGMALKWNFQTTAGVTSQVAVTPTTAGDYDWLHNGGAMYEIEIPASGGASINNDAEGFGWFTGICDGVLSWAGPKIGFRAAALNNSLIDGTTIDVNTTAISGDTTAADNLESQYDTTGLTGDTFPASQSQLSGLANVGSAVHRPAASYTLTTGTQSANTYTATEALDGTNHEHTDTAGAMELYYEFNIGSGTTSSCLVTGYVTGINDDLDVYGYDWVAAAWVQIGNIQGGALASNSVHSFDMFVDMVGSGANLGVVRVRFYKASGLTTATLAVDQIFIAFSQGESGYVDGIEVDTNASNTSTVPGIDGVKGNPVSTWAAALTLSVSTGIQEFKIINGSSIILTANSDNYSIRGQSYSVALNSQSMASIYIFGGDVTGIGTGAGAVFEDCPIGNVTLPPCVMRHCFYYGTVTNSGTGDWFINDPRSRVAGGGSPVFNFGAAVGNTNLNIRANSGGWQLEAMGDTGTDVATIEGWGQVIEGTCTGGNVTVRGNFTTSGITNLTLIDGARFESSNLVGLTWSEILSGYSINNSGGKILRELKEMGVYPGRAFYYDSTGGGSAGSTLYEHGTEGNPVDNEADLRTLLTNPGYNTIFVSPGSTLTLAGAYLSIVFHGDKWTLALGGQSISGCVFYNPNVTGISSGTDAHWHDAMFGAVTVPPGIFVGCGIGESGGTFTAASAGEYVGKDCYSLVPGSGAPNLVFTGLGSATGINNRGSFGGANYTLDSDCTLSHEVVGGGGTTITTGGADVEIRGTTRAINLTLGTATSETVQFVGVCGPITISGNPTAAVVNLYGISDGVTDTSTGSTVTDASVSQTTINTEVDSALDTAIPELGVAIPSATPTMRTGLMLLYMALRNDTKTQTSGTDALEIHNDAGTLIAKKLLTDDGADYTEAKMTSG